MWGVRISLKNMYRFTHEGEVELCTVERLVVSYICRACAGLLTCEIATVPDVILVPPDGSPELQHDLQTIRSSELSSEVLLTPSMTLRPT